MSFDYLQTVKEFDFLIATGNYNSLLTEDSSSVLTHSN